MELLSDPSADVDDYIERFHLRDFLEAWLDRVGTERPEDPYVSLVNEATAQRLSGNGVVTCPNKWCHMTMLASEYESHRSSCDYRENWVRCVRCNERVATSKMLQHRLHCRLQHCPYCGEVVLPRMLIYCPYRQMMDAERTVRAFRYRLAREANKNGKKVDGNFTESPLLTAATASPPINASGTHSGDEDLTVEGASSSASHRPTSEALRDYPDNELVPKVKVIQCLWRRHLFDERARNVIFTHVWETLDSLEESLLSSKNMSKTALTNVDLARLTQAISGGMHAIQGSSCNVTTNGKADEDVRKAKGLNSRETLIDEGSTATDPSALHGKLLGYGEGVPHNGFKTGVEIPDCAISVRTTPNEGGAYMEIRDFDRITQLGSERAIFDLGTVTGIVRAAVQILKERPIVQQISIPQRGDLVVVGDLHGQMKDLFHLIHLMGRPGPRRYYMFNGDFVDRGPYGCEVVVYVFALLCTYPRYVFLNRGNHEDYRINTEYGFVTELCAKYGVFASKVHTLLLESYSVMPLMAIVDGHVAIVHGGVPREDCTLADIEAIGHVAEIPIIEQKTFHDRLLVDLLWNDPVEKYRSRVLGPGHQGNGWRTSKRGCGVEYLQNITNRFLSANNLDFLIRSHDVKPSGFEVIHKAKCITVFSASNYGGLSGNRGAVAVLAKGAQQPVFRTWFIRNDMRGKELTMHPVLDAVLPVPESDEGEDVAAPDTATVLVENAETGHTEEASDSPPVNGLLLATEIIDPFFAGDEFIQAFYKNYVCASQLSDSDESKENEHMDDGNEPLQGGGGAGELGKSRGKEDGTQRKGPSHAAPTGRDCTLQATPQDTRSCGVTSKPPFPSHLNNKQTSLALQLSVVKEIREQVYLNRYTLLSAFSSIDELHTGVICKVEWCTVMQDVLNLDIPWYYLAQFFIPRLFIDGLASVEYTRFLYHFDAVFSADYLPIWQRFIVQRIFASLDLPEDLIAVFSPDNENQGQLHEVPGMPLLREGDRLRQDNPLEEQSSAFMASERVGGDFLSESKMNAGPVESMANLWLAPEEKHRLARGMMSTSLLRGTGASSNSGPTTEDRRAAHWRNISIDFRTFATHLRGLSPATASLEDCEVFSLFRFFDANFTGHFFLGNMIDFVEQVLHEESNNNDDEPEELLSAYELDFSAFGMRKEAAEKQGATSHHMEAEADTSAKVDAVKSDSESNIPRNQDPNERRNHLLSCFTKGKGNGKTWGGFCERASGSRGLPQPPSPTTSSNSSGFSLEDEAQCLNNSFDIAPRINNYGTKLSGLTPVSSAGGRKATVGTTTSHKCVNNATDSALEGILPSNAGILIDKEEAGRDLAVASSTGGSGDISLLDGNSVGSFGTAANTEPWSVGCLKRVSKNGCLVGWGSNDHQKNGPLEGQQLNKNRGSIYTASLASNHSSKEAKDSSIQWIYPTLIRMQELLLCGNNTRNRLEFIYRAFNQAKDGMLSEAEFGRLMGFLSDRLERQFDESQTRVLFHRIREDAFGYLKALQLQHAAMMRHRGCLTDEQVGNLFLLAMNGVTEISANDKRLDAEAKAGKAFILMEEFVTFFSITTVCFSNVGEMQMAFFDKDQAKKTEEEDTSENITSTVMETDTSPLNVINAADAPAKAGNLQKSTMSLISTGPSLLQTQNIAPLLQTGCDTSSRHAKSNVSLHMKQSQTSMMTSRASTLGSMAYVPSSKSTPGHRVKRCSNSLFVNTFCSLQILQSYLRSTATLQEALDALSRDSDGIRNKMIHSLNLLAMKSLMARNRALEGESDNSPISCDSHHIHACESFVLKTMPVHGGADTLFSTFNFSLMGTSTPMRTVQSSKRIVDTTGSKMLSQPKSSTLFAIPPVDECLHMDLHNEPLLEMNTEEACVLLKDHSCSSRDQHQRLSGQKPIDTEHRSKSSRRRHHVEAPSHSSREAPFSATGRDSPRGLENSLHPFQCTSRSSMSDLPLVSHLPQAMEKADLSNMSLTLSGTNAMQTPGHHSSGTTFNLKPLAQQGSTINTPRQYLLNRPPEYRLTSASIGACGRPRSGEKSVRSLALSGVVPGSSLDLVKAINRKSFVPPNASFATSTRRTVGDMAERKASCRMQHSVCSSSTTLVSAEEHHGKAERVLTEACARGNLPISGARNLPQPSSLAFHKGAAQVSRGYSARVIQDEQLVADPLDSGSSPPFPSAPLTSDDNRKVASVPSNKMQVPFPVPAPPANAAAALLAPPSSRAMPVPFLPATHAIPPSSLYTVSHGLLPTPNILPLVSLPLCSNLKGSFDHDKEGKPHITYTMEDPHYSFDTNEGGDHTDLPAKSADSLAIAPASVPSLAPIGPLESEDTVTKEIFNLPPENASSPLNECPVKQKKKKSSSSAGRRGSSSSAGRRGSSSSAGRRGSGSQPSNVNSSGRTKSMQRHELSNTYDLDESQCKVSGPRAQESDVLECMDNMTLPSPSSALSKHSKEKTAVCKGYTGRRNETPTQLKPLSESTHVKGQDPHGTTLDVKPCLTVNEETPDTAGSRKRISEAEETIPIKRNQPFSIASSKARLALLKQAPSLLQNNNALTSSKVPPSSALPMLPTVGKTPSNAGFGGAPCGRNSLIEPEVPPLQLQNAEKPKVPNHIPLHLPYVRMPAILSKFGKKCCKSQTPGLLPRRELKKL